MISSYKILKDKETGGYVIQKTVDNKLKFILCLRENEPMLFKKVEYAKKYLKAIKK